MKKVWKERKKGERKTLQNVVHGIREISHKKNKM